MEGLTLPFVLSVISALVSGIFAVVVLRRWRHKRRPHLLCWGIGLVLYFAGSAAQAALALFWSPFLFGIWYWSGALAVAAWLGLGSVYLLVRRGNIARNIHMALILVSVMTLPWTIFLTPMDSSVWHPGADMVTLYRDIMPRDARGTVRFFSPILNGFGTIALVGGALYSAHLFRRKQIMPNRVYGNWLIAAGGLFPALGGAFDEIGLPEFKYFGILIGAILIFAGFLLATNAPDDADKPIPDSRPSPTAAGD